MPPTHRPVADNPLCSRAADRHASCVSLDPGQAGTRGVHPGREEEVMSPGRLAGTVRVAPVNESRIRHVGRLLGVATAALLIGHGGFGAFMHRPEGARSFAAIDPSAASALPLTGASGWLEIGLGLALFWLVSVAHSGERRRMRDLQHRQRLRTLLGIDPMADRTALPDRDRAEAPGRQRRAAGFPVVARRSLLVQGRTQTGIRKGGARREIAGAPDQARRAG